MSSMALLVTDLYNLSKASAAASRTSSSGAYRARDTAGMMMWRDLNMVGEGKGQVSEKREARSVGSAHERSTYSAIWCFCAEAMTSVRPRHTPWRVSDRGLRRP